MLVADFMGALKADLATREKFTDPTTTLDEIDKKLRGLKAEIDPILNAPKPKEEPKPEEQPAEDKDKAAEPKADEPMNNAGEPKDELPELEKQ